MISDHLLICFSSYVYSVASTSYMLHAQATMVQHRQQGSQLAMVMIDELKCLSICLTYLSHDNEHQPFQFRMLSTTIMVGHHLVPYTWNNNGPITGFWNTDSLPLHTTFGNLSERKLLIQLQIILLSCVKGDYNRPYQIHLKNQPKVCLVRQC